ncbi:MAG TPA: DUF1552 domain-containing protein [Polyangiaceae bacterium]|nr:DUF1552 domain-containing protein [Polyangiaceae bacterium]
MAAPFLGSLSGRGLKAQEVRAPRRLIVMFTHYGCVTTRFFPQKSHGALTAQDLAATTLAPLAPFVDKLLLPRGIRAMNEWTIDMARGQGNDPHAQVVGSYFTCQPITPNSNDPLSSPESALFMPKPIGPSLDHVIARQLSPDGVPLLMRVGNTNDQNTSAISYSAAETIYPGLGVPSQVYQSLTGINPNDPTASPDSYQAARGKSVLDLVRDDLLALERFDMSQGDRHKLEAWKELLDQTGPIVGGAECTSELAAALGATPDNVAAAGKSSLGGDSVSTPLSDSLDGADVYSSVAALAAACNANPVIFLKYPAVYLFKGLGLTTESHGLSHRVGDASLAGTCLAGVTDMLLTVDRFYAQKFAHLVALLDGIPEGEATLLDNTATVWFQEMSDGCAHNLNNLPIVQAGSAGGYFKTGWTVNVDSARTGAADLTTGNSEVVCNGASEQVVATTQATGTDPTVANAPINKYFCSLMNALGVKAGADGFPLVGGTAEVTHYGRYDKTEDFIGGEVNPPTLHDPGEFTALKAGA